MQCPHCNYTWAPRTQKPKACPMCHRYFKPSNQPYEVWRVSQDLFNYLSKQASHLATKYPAVRETELEEELSYLLIKLEDENRIQAVA